MKFYVILSEQSERKNLDLKKDCHVVRGITPRNDRPNN